MENLKRKAGILLPIFSLPSKYGIGDFGKESYNFIDFLKKSNQSYWQILPLNPTSYGDSPYQSPSSFAGNTYFIDIEEFYEKGYISQKDLDNQKEKSKKIDYYKLFIEKNKLFKKAYLGFLKDSDKDEYKLFLEKNFYWLKDYSLFMSIKEKNSHKPFNMWEDENEKKRIDVELLYEKYEKEMEYHYFLQFFFFKQWNKLVNYAHKNGVEIIGDIPIYVSYDSADCWVNPKLFLLDNDLNMKLVAGVPPDAFTADGQLWGNPIYDWNHHKETNYSWWVERTKMSLKMYDILRIDHFRGFEAYYAIPFGEKTAINGKWYDGPNYDLFKVINEKLNYPKIIAEDLGYLNEKVEKLLNDCKYPGMVLTDFCFMLGSEDMPKLNYTNKIVYTGTHDNPPILEAINDMSKDILEEKIGIKNLSKEEICNKVIDFTMHSKPYICIIPLQDYLLLDKKSRINTPSTDQGNWQFRINKNHLSDRLISRIKTITIKSNRE